MLVEVLGSEPVIALPVEPSNFGRAEMNCKGARVKIAIIDASRRKPLERRFRPAAGLAPITATKGTVVHDVGNSRIAGQRKRLVMSELLKEMRVPDATIDEVFNRTRMGVSRATNGQQVPWFSSSLEEESSFQPASLRPVNSRPEPSPAPRPQPETPQPSAAPKPQPTTPIPSDALDAGIGKLNKTLGTNPDVSALFKRGRL